MELKELIEKYDEECVEVEYEDTGFVVSLKPMNREVQEAVDARCKTVRFDRKTHQRIEERDDRKFTEALDEILIADWKGLTLSVARRLIPTLKVPDDVDAAVEIPCSAENKRLLMLKSGAFQKFVVDVALDAWSSLAEREETEAKNSETSPVGKVAGEASTATNA